MNLKRQAGIWIDGTKAIVVTLGQNAQDIETIASNIEDRRHHNKEGDKGSFMGHQHISHEKTFEERRKHQLHSFLKEVTSSLKDVEEIYICGPAEVKSHLKKDVEAVYGTEKTVLSMDACEHMTENQLVAKIKKFFGRN